MHTRSTARQAADDRGVRPEDLLDGDRPRLRQIALGITGDLQLAEDIVQESYLRLCDNWAAVSEYDNPSAWLRRVVTNLSIDLTRSHSRRATVSLADMRYEPRGHGPEENERVVESLWLWQLVSELPDRQRAAIVLHYVADLSTKEISEILDCRVGTAKSLLSRGRRRIKSLAEASQIEEERT